MSRYERVVNVDGEVGRFVPDTANATIRTQEESERAKHFATLPARKRLYNGPSYFMSSNDAVAEIIRDLSLIEAGALIKLLLELRMNNAGRLDNIDGKPMKKSDLARILGRSRQATNSTIERLVRIGVLTVATDGCFVISERYHVRGRNTLKTAFTKMYRTYARNIIDKLSLSEIGLLYKVMPFFHYSEYYLCSNADCNPKEIEYITREALAEATGHAPDTIGKLMAKLQSVGAVLMTGTKNEVRYLVHPDLIFRQAEGVETDWTWAVRKMFDDHSKKSRK